MVFNFFKKFRSKKKEKPEDSKVQEIQQAEDTSTDLEPEVPLPDSTDIAEPSPSLEDTAAAEEQVAGEAPAEVEESSIQAELPVMEEPDDQDAPPAQEEHSIQEEFPDQEEPSIQEEIPVEEAVQEPLPEEPALEQAEQPDEPSDFKAPEEPDESIGKDRRENAADQKTGLFSRLKRGLSKTREVLTTDINELFGSNKAIDEDLFDELEELLITSDLGIDITMAMMDKIRKKAKKLSSANELKAVLKKEIEDLFPMEESLQETERKKPHVIMVVGVNGTGKTTTLGKLASRFTKEGNKVLIAAADTFRAAAIEQVEIWANRSGATIVRHKEGADPAAVAYDAVEAALARDIDIVLIDTAGRLHTQKNLMEELKKIKRSVNKKYPGAPHEVLMVLDATTGQNAISQAKLFNQAVELTQIALTKLDGTAKGGIVAAIANTMHLPIKYIGVGEQSDDLQDFDAKLFIEALFD